MGAKVNPFSIIILVALILEFVIGLVANVLNLKALRPELPSALEGMYEPNEYRRSQEYTRTLTRFSLVTGAFRLVILLAFWFTGGFNYLDQLVRGWGFGPVINGLLYIGILFVGYTLLMLPFNIYATFVIEERFGFRRITRRTFLMDLVKELALVIFLGVSLLIGVLSLFEYAGVYAWLYCWLVVILFMLIMWFILPTWIMPIFNKFTPMESGELKDAITRYTESVDFPLKNVFVMDGSRRSTKSNAFFVGLRDNKRVALYDTLIEKHTVPELIAVLAHEVGHYKKRHVLWGMIISILHIGVLFFLLSVFLDSAGLYQAFYMEQQSVYAGLLFFGLLYTPIELLLSIVVQMISRRNEYAADRFAAETIGHPGPG